MLLNLLHRIRALLLRAFGGKGLGKKFPFLWRIYDLLFRAVAPKHRFFHELEGSKFLVDPKDPIFYMRKIMQGYLTLDTYEPETTKLVREIVKPGDVALDIGASIGYFTFLLSKAVGPRGKVYAFEPTWQSFRYLCENRIANKADNVFPYRLAAWDRDEPVRMPASTFANNTQWVSGVAIGDFLSCNGVKKVDFIKMDIDGAEPWALKGIEALIKQSPQLKMIVEYYPKYIEASNGNPKDVIDLLDRYFTYEEVPGDYGDGYWNYYCQRKKDS